MPLTVPDVLVSMFPLMEVMRLEPAKKSAHPVRKYGPKTVLPHDAKSLTGLQDMSRGQQKKGKIQ